MKIIIAIDPGPVKSSAVWWDGEKICEIFTSTNEDILATIKSRHTRVIIEQVKSYGMAVGESVFETVFWSGRFAQANFMGFSRMGRMDVKMHLCGSPRAKDGNIIQALKDRFGEKPTKAVPNPVYNGFKPAADEWQAWALGVAWWDQFSEKYVL